MIKKEKDITKVIFGYGSVAVGVSQIALTLTSIKPPQEIGISIPRDANIEYGRSVYLNDLDKAFKLLKKLKEINLSEECTIKYSNDIELIFIKDSYKSVDVVIKYINKYIDFNITFLAA
jgi:hypothetical protein